MVKNVNTPERAWLSNNRAEYIDRSDVSKAALQEDEKAVEGINKEPFCSTPEETSSFFLLADSEAYRKNLPRHWREIPGFDIVRAVNLAAPLGAKLGCASSFLFLRLELFSAAINGQARKLHQRCQQKNQRFCCVKR